jgi:hypothetical protein
MDRGQTRTGKDGSDSTKSGQTQTQKSQSGDTMKSGQTQPTTTQSQQKSGTGQTQMQSGQSGTAASASLSTEQRTRIRETVIKSGSAPRISRTEINFNLNVGTVVPRTVRVVALPATVVQIYPAWRGFMFFIVGDEIVIVEPGSLRIVAILPA